MSAGVYDESVDAGYQFLIDGSRGIAPVRPWSESAFHLAMGFDRWLKAPTAAQRKLDGGQNDVADR